MSIELPKTITLTEPEIALAAMVAAQRFAQNLSVGRKPKMDGDLLAGNSFDAHVLGCLGELALARALNRFWSGELGQMRAKDVGTLQVRATYHANGHLLLAPEDQDDDRFFLVTIEQNRATVAGYMLGRDGKQLGYWREDCRRPAYWVPQSALETHIGNGNGNGQTS